MIMKAAEVVVPKKHEIAGTRIQTNKNEARKSKFEELEEGF